MEEQLLGYEGEMYRLDHAEHIARMLDRVAPRVLRTRRNLMARPPEQIRPYLKRAGWRLEFHTFYLPCGEMTITLQDVAYQLGLTIDGDPVSGCIVTDEVDGEAHVVPEHSLWRVGAGHYRGAPDEGSAVLAWLYRQMCRATEHGQRNLGGWVLYRSDNATSESRLRHYRRTLNGIEMLNLEWTSYADPQLIGIVPPAIAEAEVSSVVHISTRPLNIDDMHRLDGLFGRGEWFPQLLGGWHELWDARVHHHLPIHHHIDLHPSLAYMTWYLQWAHTELFGLGDQHLVATGVVPEDLPMHHPLAPDLHQPDDGHLLEMRPTAGGGRGPIPGGYLSLRPPGSHHSEAGTSQQGEIPEANVHFDIRTQFQLPFSSSELTPTRLPAHIGHPGHDQCQHDGAALDSSFDAGR
ncbi:uncharacterized protein DS421_20g686380 [Arachis hypogaea]|nr:uncharacterized protein DS421_20g686380 [Arachis hypogaea]